MRRLLLLATLALGACSLIPGGEDKAPPPAAQPLATSAIEVTPLAEASPSAGAVDAVPGAAIAPDATAADGGEAAALAAEDAAPVADALAPPAVVKSPSQLACERRKGTYVKVKELFTCVRTPRDAGKRCTRESDCSSRCLARSQTCAPFDPLLGCNDILDDQGRRITLCLD
ncbi:hypothetical protein [Rhodobacter sp. NSM]|uniref:hypothetical protein n=1 Tax=Rhodobacter sp. NSM TaxID=3457501 RepID=UPI003FD6B8B1